MITVYDVTIEYCKQKNLPSPSKNDLQNIGRICLSYFRKSAIDNKTLPTGVVVGGAGFKLVSEHGKRILVIAYDDCFKAAIISSIRKFYDSKGKAAVPNNTALKGTRKRIPFTHRPAYSTKKNGK